MSLGQHKGLQIEVMCAGTKSMVSSANTCGADDARSFDRARAAQRAACSTARNRQRAADAAVGRQTAPRAFAAQRGGRQQNLPLGQKFAVHVFSLPALLVLVAQQFVQAVRSGLGQLQALEQRVPAWKANVEVRRKNVGENFGCNAM
jgi:hypothetical protein